VGQSVFLKKVSFRKLLIIELDAKRLRLCFQRSKHVLFDGRSKKIQWGYLFTWQHSFAGDSDVNYVNTGAFQYFVFYQLGKGHYLRSAPVCAFDLRTEAYTIPVGLGYGKVMKKGNTVYNAFIEPQVSLIDEGPNP